MAIRFTEEHLRGFTAASMDTSPLHTSESYARKTPFGERLVYGSLAVAACLGRLSLPAGKAPSGIRVEYKGPIVLGVDYSLQVIEEEAGTVRVLLMDGTVPAVRIRLFLRDGSPRMVELPETGVASRTESRSNSEGFVPGLRCRGRYAPPRAAYSELLQLLDLDRGRWGDELAIAVLCGSYLSGMEIPGESGASAGLQAVLESPMGLPCDYEIELESHDPRFGRVESRFTLRGEGGVYAAGKVLGIVRPSLAKIAAPAARTDPPRYAGKTALVIGASRGLGAAMALDLAAQGCTVVGGYFRSGEDAAVVEQAGGALAGRLTMEHGDASQPQWCSQIKERLQSEFGRLDLLVLNAAPAILPLRVEMMHFARIQWYLQKGFALVGVPLSSLLDLVSASEGSVLLISSAAVENPPAVWPHYAALKGAAEGLVRAAAADHSKVRFSIARPAKIATDLINTPLGRMDAEQPSTVARRILDHVAEYAQPGTVYLCA